VSELRVGGPRDAELAIPECWIGDPAEWIVPARYCSARRGPDARLLHALTTDRAILTGRWGDLPARFRVFLESAPKVSARGLDMGTGTARIVCESVVGAWRPETVKRAVPRSPLAPPRTSAPADWPGHFTFR